MMQTGNCYADVGQWLVCFVRGRGRGYVLKFRKLYFSNKIENKQQHSSTSFEGILGVSRFGFG